MCRICDLNLDSKEQLFNYQDTDLHLVMKVDFVLIDKIKYYGSFYELLEILDCSSIEFFLKDKDGLVMI